MTAKRVRRPGSREVFHKNTYTRGAAPPRIDRRERVHGSAEAVSSQTGEDHQQKRYARARGLRFLAVVLLLMSLIIFSGIWYSAVTVMNTTEASSAAYDQTVDEYLSDNWTKRSRYTFSGDDLMTALQDRHPEIQAVSYDISATGQLTVSVKLRYPAAVARFAQTKDTDYYIDSTGVPYRATSPIDDKNLLPLIQDTTDVQPSPDQAVMSVQTLDFITLLNTGLSNSKTVTSRVGSGGEPFTYVLTDLARSIEITHKSWDFRIRVTSDRGVNDQISELEQTLEYIDQQRLRPQKYIDLRVDDTAYIR